MEQNENSKWNPMCQGNCTQTWKGLHDSWYQWKERYRPST